MTSFPWGCLVCRKPMRRNFCDGNGRGAQSRVGAGGGRTMVAAMSEIDTKAAADLFTEMLRIQGEAAREMMAAVLPEAVDALPTGAEMSDWGEAALKLQRMWLEFHAHQAVPEMPVPLFADPAEWMGLMQGWYQQMPWLDPARQQ